MLEITNLQVRGGTKDILRGINLNVKKGEIGELKYTEDNTVARSATEYFNQSCWVAASQPGPADAATRADADGWARGHVPGSWRPSLSVRTPRRLTALIDRRLYCANSVCRSAPSARVRFPLQFKAIIPDGLR